MTRRRALDEQLAAMARRNAERKAAYRKAINVCAFCEECGASVELGETRCRQCIGALREHEMRGR